MGKIKKVMTDVAEITGEAILSMIPGPAGTLLPLVFNKVKENALAKREEAWKAKLEERLRKIEKSLDEIGSNERFTTALIHSTEIAIKTSSEEKRVYLANAVANSISTDIAEEQMVVFFQLLEKYTVAHIRILSYFRDPSLGKGIMLGSSSMPSSIWTRLSAFVKQFGYERDYCMKIIRDLQNDSVLNDFTDAIMTEQSALSKRTTPLGNRFLAFVEEKPNED